MAGLLDLQLLFHGAVVLILGLLCGIPFGAAAARAREGSARAWRVAHSGGATLGLMLVAIGATLSRLRLDDLALSTLTWSLVVSGYAFMLGMVLAALAGTRGLRAEGPPLNWVVFGAYVVGSVGSVVGVGLMIRGAWTALRAGPG
jgi:hypothetical protein